MCAPGKDIKTFGQAFEALKEATLALGLTNGYVAELREKLESLEREVRTESASTASYRVETAGLRADIASWRAEVVGWRSEVPATWRDLILSRFDRVDQGIASLTARQSDIIDVLAAMPRGRGKRGSLAAKETQPDAMNGDENSDQKSSASPKVT
jgi:hypothetical protein